MVNRFCGVRAWTVEGIEVVEIVKLPLSWSKKSEYEMYKKAN